MSLIEHIDVVILCGGLATRLKGIVDDVPKVMAEINGRLFLDILMNQIQNQGLRRVVLCTGHKSEVIEDYCRKKNYASTIVISKEVEPMGTGGALKHAYEVIRSNPFIVINGDSFCDVNFRVLTEYHLRQHARATVVISKVKNANDFGKIVLNENQSISGYHEKQISSASNDLYVNAGMYCLDQDIFSYMPEQDKFSLEYDVFPQLIHKRFFGFTTNEEFIDIGTPERYREAQKKRMN